MMRLHRKIQKIVLKIHKMKMREKLTSIKILIDRVCHLLQEDLSTGKRLLTIYKKHRVDD